MERKVAAGYIRVSSNMQAEEGLSLDHQIMRINQYCHDKNVKLLDIYEDAGRSGFSNDVVENKNSIKRQGMLLVINAIKNKKIDLLITTKNDRLGRDQFEKIFIKKLCRRNKVEIIFLDQPHLNSASDDPMDRLIDGLMDLLDEFYSLNLSLEVKKIHTDLAKKGLYTGGRVPYGYKLREVLDEKGRLQKDLVKDENYSPIVELIFNLYEQGLGFTRIANHLIEINAPRPEGRWTHQNVSIILKNENYAGRVWNRYESKRKDGKLKDRSEWVYGEGDFETIISKEQFERVQEMMGKRAKNTNRERSVDYDNRGAGIYALTGLVKCNCGRNMTVSRNTSSRSKTVNYYFSCPRNKSLPTGQKCSNNINVAKLDYLVWKELCNFMKPEQIIQKVNEYLLTKSVENRSKNEKIHHYKNTIKEKEKQVDNLFNVISTLDVSQLALINSYNSRIQTIQQELDETRELVEQLGEPLEEDLKFPEIDIVVKEGLLSDQYYQHIKFEVLQKLFSSLIERVDITKRDKYKSEVEISFRLNHPAIQKMIDFKTTLNNVDLPNKHLESPEEKEERIKYEQEMYNILKKNKIAS